METGLLKIILQIPMDYEVVVCERSVLGEKVLDLKASNVVGAMKTGNMGRDSTDTFVSVFAHSTCSASSHSILSTVSSFIFIHPILFKTGIRRNVVWHKSLNLH